MNHIPSRNTRQDEEIARVREIVARHRFPDFVTGFDVLLGEHEGPALWIVFKTVEKIGRSELELKRETAELLALRSAVRDDLLEEIEDRWPYFRFRQL